VIFVTRKSRKKSPGGGAGYGPEGRIPAEASLIRVDGRNKRETIIQNVVNKSLYVTVTH